MFTTTETSEQVVAPFSLLEASGRLFRMNYVTGETCVAGGVDAKWVRLTEPEYAEATIFYGPHQCSDCGEFIVKAEKESGGAEFDWPGVGPYPNHKWVAHVHRVSDRPMPSAHPPVNACR